MMGTQALLKYRIARPGMQRLSLRLGLGSNTVRSSGFYLYMVFLISYFLHLPARLDIAAYIRLDLLLVILISFLVIIDDRVVAHSINEISKKLYFLFFYILITLPFVEWPGSVIRNNYYVFIKAVVFFFFTVYTIRTEKDLKIFMLVFISCQCFRIFEPVWLHITTEYWGGVTSMDKWGTIWLNRLSGSPYDVINPNGLAWVIVSIIPFMFYLSRSASLKKKFSFIFPSRYFFMPYC